MAVLEGSTAKWFANLLPGPAASSSTRDIPKNVLRKEIKMLQSTAHFIDGTALRKVENRGLMKLIGPICYRVMANKHYSKLMASSGCRVIYKAKFFLNESMDID